MQRSYSGMKAGRACRSARAANVVRHRLGLSGAPYLASLTLDHSKTETLPVRPVNKIEVLDTEQK
jgi:hypothetical protein